MFDPWCIPSLLLLSPFLLRRRPEGAGGRMPYEKANRNESLLYFLCLGNSHSKLQSVTAQLNFNVNCKGILGEKLLEDMFCMGPTLGSQDHCQVSLLTSVMHKFCLCLSSFIECLSGFLNQVRSSENKRLKNDDSSPPCDRDERNRF